MSFIIKVTTSFPEQTVNQDDLECWLTKMFPDKKLFISNLMANSTIDKRHFTLPLNYYRDLKDVGKKNIIWKAESLNLQIKNIEKILKDSKIPIDDIGLITSVTSTGMSVPGLESLLMNHFPFATNTRGLPLFGLGCLGGFAGMNIVNDYLLLHPKKAAILLVTELNSLSFQIDDCSDNNIIATSLYGDGAAAVLMVGKDNNLCQEAEFELLKTERIFYNHSEQINDWNLTENGHQLIFSDEISKFLKLNIKNAHNQFFNKNQYSSNDINFYMTHLPDPQIVDIISESLELGKNKFELSFNTLKNKGNLSAVSTLHILEQFIDLDDLSPNSVGLMMAFGPGVSSEMALIKKC